MKRTIIALIALLPFAAHAQTAEQILEHAVKARFSGRPDISLSILEALEKAKPRSAQVKFEKAVVLAELGRCAAAQRTFNAGQDLTPLPSFKRASEDAMDDLCPKIAGFETDFYFDIGHQSNVNGGSENETVTINGLEFALSDEAQAQSANFLRTGGTIAYKIALSRLSYLVPEVGLDAQLYDDPEYSLVTPIAGLFYRYRGDRNDFRVGPTYAVAIGSDGREWHSKGVAGTGTYSITPASALSYGVTSQNKQYDRSPEESHVLSASATYVHVLDRSGLIARVGASFSEQDSTNFMNDISQRSIFASATGKLGHNYGYEVSLRRTWAEGKNVDPFFAVKRRDTITSAGVNISLPISHPYLGRPYIGASYSVSDSTFETKNFENTGVTFGMTRSF